MSFQTRKTFVHRNYNDQTLRLNHRHMDYFINVFTTFLDLEHVSFVSCIAVYGGSESSRISSKIS